jgi:hypothetical protein
MKKLDAKTYARSIIRDVQEQGCCYDLKPKLTTSLIRVHYTVDGDRIGFYKSSKDFGVGLPGEFRQAVVDEMEVLLQGQEKAYGD